MNGWQLRQFRGLFRRLSRDGDKGFFYDVTDISGRLDLGELWIFITPELAQACIKGEEVTFEALHAYFPQGIKTQSGRRIYHRLRIANPL